MNVLFLIILFLPLFSKSQTRQCKPLDTFWEMGAAAIYPHPLSTAVGFRLSYHKVLCKEGVYFGDGVEAIRLQNIKASYLPVSFSLTVMPLNKAVGPVAVISPAYHFLQNAAPATDKTMAA